MASRKSHRYLSVAETVLKAAAEAPNDQLELEEADVWSTYEDVIETKKQGRQHRKALRKSVDHFAVGPKSLPVNVPAWSKVLQGCWDDDDDDDEEKIAPHEYLARIRGASLSVHQGVGRTLKGRDLSRLRNAIWKHIGFED